VSVKSHMYYFACTYRVPEFHVASGVMIQIAVRWLRELWCLCLLYICWTASSTVYYQHV